MVGRVVMDWTSKWDRVESNMYLRVPGEINVRYLCESLTAVMAFELRVNLELENCLLNVSK